MSIESREEKEIKSMVNDFTALLDSIAELDVKTRGLYKEIYENAITDRANAHTLLNKLIALTGSDSTEHAVHGKAMSSYIERMTRSNDQLIKLVEMLTNLTSSDGELDTDSLFKQIQNSRRQ